jgi:hypothetical protein
VAALVEQLRPAGLPAEPVATPEHRSVDWPGYPVRIDACLGRDRTLALLDRRVAGVGDLGRLRHQEEYLEWRVVRDGDRIRRIEMTTELSDYWEVLAAHEPERTLALVSSFAGEEVGWPDVYAEDPFAPAADPESRAGAFRRRMLPEGGDPSEQDWAEVSPFATGERALCFMLHHSNTLGALLHLGLAAMTQAVVVDDLVTGRVRYASGAEVIPLMGNAAQDGRSSDPVVVEAIAQLVAEGRPVAVDDPVGIAIRGVQRTGLARADGREVPEEWFTFGRGVRADQAPDGRQRCQRLTLEVPPEAGSVDDIVVRRTGERLRFGGQLAALVQLTAHLRTGPIGADRPRLLSPPPEPDPPTCADALPDAAAKETGV